MENKNFKNSTIMKTKISLSTKLLLLTLLIFNFQLLTLNSFSQNVGINTTGNMPNDKALLDLDASPGNDKGLLIPRLSTTNRDAIAAPIPESLLIYNTTTQCFEAWNGDAWVAFGCICQLPGTFTATTATNITATSFDANWTASAGASTYYLDVNTNINFTGTAILNNYDVGNVTSFTVSDLSLSCGTSYYYRLRASNDCGSGVSSNIIEITTYECFTPGCGTGTTIVDVTNPTTGKTWMDRNLGASRQATSSTDYLAYGALFQWGRAADGHECITWTSSTNGTPQSSTTSTLATSNTPGHSDFITNNASPYDWRNSQNNNLWQGVSGTNNPCPSGYRLPTEAEWNAERTSWSSNTSAGAYASPLKLPVAGGRSCSSGSLFNVGSHGHYSSSTIDGTNSRFLIFNSSTAVMLSYFRADGYSVRCIKD